MKKILFIAVAFCMSYTLFAQETEPVKKEPVNELKLNLATTLALYPEISYERSIVDDLGLGLSVAVALDDDLFYNFQLTPYFRFYFGSKPHKTFFIEANAALISCEEDEYYEYSSRQTNVLDFGLGFSVGYKFFNRKGFTGELYLGVGRTFGDRAYPRVGIALGKQF